MNPDPFTMRELLSMVEGRGKFAWGMTSSLMALMANLNRDPRKGNAATPADFNPFTPKAPKIVLRGEEMKEALKAAFCKKRR